MAGVNALSCLRVPPKIHYTRFPVTSP